MKKSLAILTLFLSLSNILSAQEPFEFTGRSNRRQTASPKEKAFYQQMIDAMKPLGDGKNSDSTRKVTLKLTDLLKLHPDYSDGFLLRATTNLQMKTGKDYQQVIEDINKAISLRSVSPYESAYKNTAPHFSMRAKAEKQLGNYKAAVDDFEKAILFSPTTSSDVLNTSGTNPDEPKDADLWTKHDFNELIEKFPNDYRVYFFRGFFYSAFTTFDEKHYAEAIADYEKAIALDSTKVLSYFLLADLYGKASFWTKKVWSDLSGQERKNFQAKALPLLDHAIALNPDFREAYASRANAHYSLEEYELAIEDYNKLIELRPNDASAYNDRGLANFYLGNHYNAIHDFDHAIEIKDTLSDQSSTLDMSYESRANTYLKVSNYPQAIEDFGRAIQAKLGNMVILMNLPQIKTIYPEFKQLSDAALTKKLWEKFGSNLQFKDFSDLLAKNRGDNFASTILPDLYINRADACLCNLEFKKAIREYKRALNGFPDYADAIERWRLFSTSPRSQHFLDIKNVEIRSGQAEFWCKEIFSEVQQNGKAYTLTHWMVLCSSKIIKLNESIDYDSDGSVLNTWSGADWRKVVPDTFGEFLYKGWCESKK